MEQQPGTHSRIVHSGLRVHVGYPNLSKTSETIPSSSKQTRELSSRSRKAQVTRAGDKISVHPRTTGRLDELSQAKPNYSEHLRTTLVSKGIWHRFIEFNESVRTVEEAARKVSADKIIKSIVPARSDQQPILAILPPQIKTSYNK